MTHSGRFTRDVGKYEYVPIGVPRQQALRSLAGLRLRFEHTRFMNAVH
jgi:hypothetical protein